MEVPDSLGPCFHSFRTAGSAGLFMRRSRREARIMCRMRSPHLLAVIAVSVILATPNAHLSAQTTRYVLTSVEQNVDVGDWQVGARETGITPDAQWSVRRQRLHGGKQDGVDVIVIDNGRMTITLVPTRGMGILRVVSGDMRLGWDSPVREVVNPKYMNLEARGGLGWLEGFNEWMARCGLEWAGHPGQDRFINNLGEQAEMNLTLHGSAHESGFGPEQAKSPCVLREARRGVARPPHIAIGSDEEHARAVRVVSRNPDDRNGELGQRCVGANRQQRPMRPTECVEQANPASSAIRRAIARVQGFIWQAVSRVDR